VATTTVWEALQRALSPVEDRPRVAPNVESAQYVTRTGSPYVVIHNPATESYARLDPREFDLLDLMDGQHSVKELVIAYYQRHGVLALPRVAGLVQLLRSQGFLAGQLVNAYALLTRQLQGDGGRARIGLQTELTTDSADGLLQGWYAAWGHVFFHRVWLWLGLLAGFVGAALVLTELGRGRYTLFDVGGSVLLTIVLLVALALITLALHELGHGLAVKHAGRRVHRAGLRLYFGLPAAYVDTTDVWMASPRQRLLTAFAGPWTGLVLGAVCAIGAELAPDGPLGAFLFTAAFVFLVDNIFNFNPLLELDGYYILVDLIDRPLLRARALAFVRGPLWGKLRRREGLSGEERLFTLFGLASLAYGVLAIIIAIRAWQALALPLIVAGWQSGELLPRLGVLVVVAAVAVPVGIGLVSMLRQVARLTNNWLTWLGGRARTHRYREALAALRAVPLFAELPQGRLLEVARRMQAEDVARGVEVVRQGERGDRFYLIGSGAFEVLVNHRSVVRLTRGDYFGERALLHAAPRAATVVAVEPSRVFALDKVAFDELLASDLAARARLEAALDYRAEVAAMPLFRDLSPGELDVLLGRMTPLVAEAGEAIIRQGEPGQQFYVVRAGQVDVERDGEVLARLGPGDAFGEIALLLDVPRTATVVAVDRTELLALEAHDFRDVLGSYLGRTSELQRLSHLRLRTHKRLDEIV
jgi:putative peptide zinc metalloprotease protein